MKTKQDLLDIMGSFSPKACADAYIWVDAEEGTAEEILLRLDRVDWLCWLLGRLDPHAMVDFARGCADRAIGYAARVTADCTVASYNRADAAYYAARAVEFGELATRAAEFVELSARAHDDYTDYTADAACYAYYADHTVECVGRAVRDVADYALRAAGAAYYITRVAGDDDVRKAERDTQLLYLHKIVKKVCKAK
jgi:hypothetical protein